MAVVWVDDDDLTAKAFALADNHTAELGDYDLELLASMISEVSADADLFAATAYTAEDLADLLGSNSKLPLTDPDDVPETRQRSPNWATCGCWASIGCCVGTRRCPQTWRG